MKGPYALRIKSEFPCILKMESCAFSAWFDDKYLNAWRPLILDLVKPQAVECMASTHFLRSVCLRARRQCPSSTSPQRPNSPTAHP
jgi:hypothetical protein